MILETFSKVKDSVNLRQMHQGSKAMSVLTLRWERTDLTTDLPSIRVSKSRLLLQLVVWGNTGSSPVRHQRPHREVELSTLCFSRQSHDKMFGIPHRMLLRDCIQTQVVSTPWGRLSSSSSPSLWSCSMFDKQVLRNKNLVCASFCGRSRTCGFLTHCVVWFFQRGNFILHRDISNSPGTCHRHCWTDQLHQLSMK